MDNIEKSLLEFVLTKQINNNSLSTQIQTIDSLSDGVVLTELMHQVNPDKFSPITAPPCVRNHWAFKLGSLTKLLQGLESFYASELQVEIPSLFTKVDCALISKMNHRPSLMFLLELVLGALVKCPQKEKFVSRIMSLSQSVQSDLMVFIQSSLQLFEAPTPEDTEQRLQDLRNDNRRLLACLEGIQESLSEALQENETLTHEISVLRQSPEPAKSNLTNSFLLEDLESDLKAKQNKIQELEHSLLEARKHYTAEINALKDEVDLGKDVEVKLMNNEKQLELYKREYEQCKAFKKKYKEIEEERDLLKEKLAEQNEEPSTVKRTLNYYKDKLEQSQLKNTELSQILEEKENSIVKLFKDIRRSEEERIALKQEIAFFRKDVEFSAVDSVDSGLSYRNDLEYQGIGEETTNELGKMKEDNTKKLISLQEDLQSMTDHCNHYQMEVERLEKYLEPFERLRRENEQYMKEVKELYKEKDGLAQRLVVCQEEVFSLKNTLSQHEFTLNNVKRELEKAENSLLELKENENITMQQLQVLQSSSHDTNDTNDTVKSLQIQRDMHKLQSQISNLTLQLREKDDEIKMIRNEKERAETELINKIKSTEETLKNTYEQESKTLSDLLSKKDMEVSYHIKSKNDLKAAWEKESKLMATALYELGLQVIKKEDKSWMAHKRFNL